MSTPNPTIQELFHAQIPQATWTASIVFSTAMQPGVGVEVCLFDKVFRHARPIRPTEDPMAALTEEAQKVITEARAWSGATPRP